MIRDSRPVDLPADRAHDRPHPPSDRVHAIEIQLDPGDEIPCRTPFDRDAKEYRLPEADYADLGRAGAVHVLGGARVEAHLRAGAALCGWARYIQQPGLFYPAGWEGELFDGSGKLLAAWSFYFDRKENKQLARSWRFSREGSVERLHIDEGGAFIRHDAVRIHHGGKSVVSRGAQEVLLRAGDGTFAVMATSDLTEGRTPVFVGVHDGFFFSAVRIAE